MNKTIGSTLIVAGTTIGGGMLAMPLTSAGIGFGFTVFLLIALWALLTYSALLFVEVYQTVESDAGIGTLAEKFFGKSGRVFATSILLIFLYALVSAYISGGSTIFAGLLPHLERIHLCCNSVAYYLQSSLVGLFSSEPVRSIGLTVLFFH